MSEQTQSLHYGDLVRIHGVNINKEEMPQGLIIAKGFTDCNIYYQTYQRFDEVNFYRESLFQILPKSNFDLHDQYLDYLTNQKVKNSIQRKNRKQRAAGQIDNFFNELASKAGQKIKYGAEVVFRHVESQEYLCGVLKAADIGEGAFKLQLRAQLSSQILFQIRSHRTYQNQGNDVYYDDCLQLYHKSSDCYVNFPPNTNDPAFLDKKQQKQLIPAIEDEYFKYYQQRPKIKKPYGVRIPIINENKSKCLWKFINHCSYNDYLSKQKIKSHDIVYFEHTKNKGLVASTLADQKYYLKEEKQKSSEGPSYECFWQLVPKEVNQFGPETCKFFWARNIVTGQILTYGENTYIEIESKDKIKGGGFKSQGLINLICGQNMKLERGQEIPLDLNMPVIEKYFEQKIEKIDFKAVESLSEDSFIIVKVGEQTIKDVAYVLSSHQYLVKFLEIFSSKVLEMQNKSKQQYKNMFMSLLNIEDFFKSVIKILKFLCAKIFSTDYEEIKSSGNTPIRQIQKILVQTGIPQLLIQIIFLLFEPFEEIERNTEVSEDKVIRNRIVQIFQISYRLLQKIASGYQDNRIYLSRWVDLFLSHSRKINKQFIQETLVCILYNNPVTIEQTINQQKIQQLIQSFFIEAKPIIQNPLTEQILTTKYLKLFSTFIKCQDRVIKENQTFILNKFFNRDDNNLGFKFKVEYTASNQEEESDDPRAKQKAKKAKISFGKEQFCEIPDFFIAHPNKFNYLMSYINLLADVCMDRNNYAIEAVQFIMPLSVVSAVLIDSKIEKLRQDLQQINQESRQSGKQDVFPQTNIHEPFIRIAHHAYINNEKFSPIKRIKRIKNWYQAYEHQGIIVENINKTKRAYEGQKQEEQKQYLKYIRDYIKEFLQNCDQKKNNLETLNTVLNLLKETIILGLWDEIQDFRSMIPALAMRILKIESIVFFGQVSEQEPHSSLTKDQILVNREQLKLNRPQIALLIDCKIKATQIFRCINQMQIDIRLRYLMHFFQGLYDATENFQIYNSKENDFKVNIQDIEEQEKQELEKKITERNETAKEQFFKVFGSMIFGNIKKVSEEQDIMLKQNIWYNKLNKMIPIQATASNQEQNQMQDQGGNEVDGGNRNLFKYSQSFDNVILSLFELSGYQNKNLLNSTLTMLRAMFGQRRDLIENYKEMLICGKGNLNQVYMTLKFMRNKFGILQDHSILKFDGNVNKSFPYAIWKPYDHLGKEESKRSGIIQDLFFLARTLKDNVSLKNIESLMHVEEDVFNESIIYKFYNERERNNSLFQQLNMAEGIYIPLINYIKLVGDSKITEIHRRLLFSIYQYLTLLCFNNMKAKHILMKYIPDILKHLGKKVEAASFLYEVCINNKLLVNNQQLVNTILDQALGACIKLETFQNIGGVISNFIQDELNFNFDYEKCRILYALRGVLLFGDEGHKKNQQMLMDKLQDIKYRRLVYKKQILFNDKIHKFDLTPSEAYVTTHFELFSALVESENLINIGKLQNMHPYKQYCLKALKSTNRLQVRRALRSYVNRLYYINKDKDIFMFEEFIRNQFNILNVELKDLIQLHRQKKITQDLKIKNGIRFSYAISEIILMIIQILVTLHEIFLKPQFIKLLKRELSKENRMGDDDKKIIHNSMILLLKNLGCVLLLYPKTKPISPFINQIRSLMTPVLLEQFHVRYLEGKSQPEQQQKQRQKSQEQVQVSNKKAYSYDHSRSFFRNLCQMIRDLKSKQRIEQLKDDAIKRKSQIGLPQNELKLKYIEVIFSVAGENLKPILDRNIKKVQQLHYKPHLQTAHSKVFRVLAKPDLEENQQNIELNKRLNSVKQLMDDAPVFKKLKDDQFYSLVRIFKRMDQTSTQFYTIYWPKTESPIPIFSKKEIIKNIFSLIMNNPTQISDNQKIFVIKLIRCYISEAVEEHQDFKLSVDKWSADYYTDESNAEEDDEKKSELVRRQHQIEECGGSDFIISIFKENLTDRVELLNEALLLGIVYLYNGNKKCQNSILASLKADPENLMLLSVKNIISFIANFLIEVRKMKDYEKVRNFAYKTVDSYDHFNTQQKTLTKQFGHNSSDKFQIQTELNYELALCRSFRFLQLFCQSNNTDMKNFLLIQKNQDDNPKTNIINFVSQTCLLLRKLFKIMNDKVVGIPASLLDFINEITQIPCIETQLSLLRSTFFEDISYMAGFFESKENIRQRKFNFVPSSDDDPLNKLCEIYEKGIGLAMSNFQGNDNQIIWQFLNKGQPKYLWIVIKQNLVRMLKENAEQWKVDKEGIDKQLQSDTSVDKQTLRDYREFIVEQRYVNTLLDRFEEKQIKILIQKQKSRGKAFREEICNIINVIALLKKIDDYAALREKQATSDKQNPNLAENAKALKAKEFRKDLMSYGQNQYKNFQKFMLYFEGLIIQIEVSSFNGKQTTFQNLYFPHHPVFKYLAEDSKDSIMLAVSRDTQRDKLISLFENYENIKDEIEQNYELNYLKYQPFGQNGKQFNLSITSNLIGSIRDTARYVSYFICALMLYLIVLDHDTIEQTSYFTYYNYKDKLIMKITCGVQLTLTILFFVLWLIMKSKLSLLKYSRGAEEPENNQNQAEEQETVEDEDQRDHWLAKLRTAVKPYRERLNRRINHFKSKLSQFTNFIKQNTLFQRFINPIIVAITTIFQTIIGLHTYESGFLSILVFVISSFLGNFVGVQWYTMHLFDFFVGISLLTNVFKAILDNIKLLALLSGLAGCFILVFNIISLNTYVPVIYEEQVPKQACQDFLGCVLELYTSGAIGDDMDQLYVGRFMFDTLYVVFMEMIFQGLVGGIIIDSFMGLKQEDSVRDEDKKTNCYICAMKKPDMQKMGTTFNKHIEKHHLWYYVFYKYCLELKDQTDYTGIEYDITEKIKQGDVTWFPDNGEKDVSGEIELLVQKFKTSLENMNKISSNLSEKGTSSIELISQGMKKAIQTNKELKQIRDREGARQIQPEA